MSRPMQHPRQAPRETACNVACRTLVPHSTSRKHVPVTAGAQVHLRPGHEATERGRAWASRRARRGRVSAAGVGVPRAAQPERAGRGVHLRRERCLRARLPAGQQGGDVVAGGMSIACSSASFSPAHDLDDRLPLPLAGLRHSAAALTSMAGHAGQSAPVPRPWAHEPLPGVPQPPTSPGPPGQAPRGSPPPLPSRQDSGRSGRDARHPPRIGPWRGSTLQPGWRRLVNMHPEARHP